MDIRVSLDGSGRSYRYAVPFPAKEFAWHERFRRSEWPSTYGAVALPRYESNVGGLKAAALVVVIYHDDKDPAIVWLDLAKPEPRG